MNDFENIKNEIKIPRSVDLAIKAGIERGRKEKRSIKLQRTYKKVAAAAAILFVAVTAGIVHPEIVKAIPGINSIFKLINHGSMGESFDKFEQFSSSVNKTIEKSGIKITIDEIVIDDNVLAITSTEEGENLKENSGYMGHIKLNGNLIRTRNSKDKKVNDNKLATVTYANVADLDLSKDIAVDLNIVWFGDVKGPWDFKFKVSKADKPTNSKVINLNEDVKIPNSTLKVDKLVMSPLGNTLSYLGVFDSSNNSMINGIKDFIIIDDKGKCLQTKSSGSSSNNLKYNGKIEILNDLTDINSITVIPIFKQWGIKSKQINEVTYSILQTTVNNSDFTVPQETIIKSRPVTEKEKSSGYFLDNVTHIFNIDKGREFANIDKLIGQRIKVGSSNTIFIKNIEATDKETKITFKIEGNGLYYYRNFDNAVIFDENYNDVERAEDGYTAVMENANEGIASIKLPPINKTKKYKIAIPIIDEPQIDEKYKINIDLAK
ncbi:DUF4179 domain-containing protein [Clostridium sp. YIM B02515]|uniref:DUF4179 domain-containing protein n=1 Tax=Clostridium rhizosphaerae TaxID=2803861 RepID=A0ABS1T6G6_9CLOT|nr:DUF4179 domain-containing protein [Clostridium rhizosphaerae]MBL4934342.1 DUF4179 domain-containing protein [Clostridium rhizosphaerae]